MAEATGLEFVVGAEKTLADVLGATDALPLLEGACRGGVARAVILASGGAELWSTDSPGGNGVPRQCWPLYLEGEVVGNLALEAGRLDAGTCQAVGKVLAGALNAILTANLKRMLTTEIHTRVVNQSYEELQESNRLLAESEGRYRNLAQDLERRVQERTVELQQAYTRLIQQEKMASVGQLAAGIAHEINNPLGFVLSNLRSLDKYIGRFLEMLDFYREQEAAGRIDPGAAAEHRRRLKLDWVSEDCKDLLGQSLGGAERVQRIVSDLRGFSHVDDPGPGPLDLNVELDRTLSVLAHEIPPGTRIERRYASLPPLRGERARFGQLFLNLLLNAFQARREGLKLTLTTANDGDAIQVIVADNGPGIPEAIRGRIFEPFFTTKEVGQGTGLGLAVVYDVVTGHGGSITVESGAAGGASFSLHLPLRS